MSSSKQDTRRHGTLVPSASLNIQYCKAAAAFTITDEQSANQPLQNNVQHKLQTDTQFNPAQKLFNLDSMLRDDSITPFYDQYILFLCLHDQ